VCWFFMLRRAQLWRDTRLMTYFASKFLAL
jgi:hypothetical protein